LPTSGIQTWFVENLHWLQVVLYLFVDSAELSVLVEQQQFLLVSRGDSHTLSDQSDLLLSGQQPAATHRTHILCPASHTNTQVQLQRKCSINKFMMKNIIRGFPLISKHMCAQKNISVLLNTHSHRVHLQRIESELLCTHTHACSHIMHSRNSDTHPHRVVHFSAS